MKEELTQAMFNEAMNKINKTSSKCSSIITFSNLYIKKINLICYVRISEIQAKNFMFVDCDIDDLWIEEEDGFFNFYQLAGVHVAQNSCDKAFFEHCKILKSCIIAQPSNRSSIFNFNECHFGFPSDNVLVCTATPLCHMNNCTFAIDPPMECPKEGEFIGYKVCYIDGVENQTACIVKLMVPFDAKRSSAFSNKCRCSKAKVLGLYSLDGEEITDTFTAVSMKSGRVSYYIVGHTTYADSWDDDRFHECSGGIHFFMSFEKAVKYYKLIW